jgi:hypothetical protein
MWWLIAVGTLCIGYALFLLSGLGEPPPSLTPSKLVVSLSPPIRRRIKAAIKALKFRNKLDEKKIQTDKGLSDSTIKRIQDEGTRYTDK